MDRKTSLKIPQQLPEFIRSDTNYETFVTFMQAYYEWMEQKDIGSSKLGATYGSQSLLNYADIDYVEPGESFNKFIDYYVNEFLPNFPKDALADKTKLIKIAKEFYNSKGTPSSYQFLFRALYNSDADIFFTRDVVFKASDGKWYVSKSLRLDTNDETFLDIGNYRVFGETSKSIAVVERGVVVGNRIELYISNIERLFESGEFIRVVDNRNQTLYFKDGKLVEQSITGSAPLRAKILGSISSIQINNTRRGQLYKGRTSTYSGDPVVFYGGLREKDDPPALAYVYETTAGSIRAVDVINGSQGYRPDPNTYIRFTGGGGSGAIANVGTVEPAGEINVAFIPQDFLSFSVQTFSIGSVYSFFGANTSATANCTLANAFTFTGFSTYPISSVIVNNGGGGYTSLPLVTALSLYDTTDPQPTPNLKVKGNLGSLGILGPIQIVDGGTGYANGEYIIFQGGTGFGANANVSVNSSGTIISVNYRELFNSSNVCLYPRGGLGYKNSALPTLNVATTSGANAVLRIDTVLGDGAELVAIPDERGIGAITSFIIEDFGEDYISAPNVSLRVRDIIVQNVNPSEIVKSGELIYQGASQNTTVFRALVDSIRLIDPEVQENLSKYVLRVYNYSSNTKLDQQLKVTDRISGANVYLDIDTTYNTLDESGNYLFRNGVRTYGNGAAQAAARFLNGLIIGEGRYLNDDGFPSSYKVLENEDYNNFTYQLTVQAAFKAYKEVLFKLLHPSGTKITPVYALKSSLNVSTHYESFQSNSRTLGSYTGDAGSKGNMYASWSNPSNNIIKFTSLVGTQLNTYVFVGSTISITNSNKGPNVFSSVVSVDNNSNTVVLSENTFLRFANVAVANVVSSNSIINITSITNAYDLINNGEYSNTQNKLYDIAFNGDKIRIVSGSNNHETTIDFVSYSNNVLFLNTSPSFTSNNANVSIGRDIESTSVLIFDTLGSNYYPNLTTENNELIITENNYELVLG